ncbi:MAG: hypothetical protein SFW35_07080 [Chitinophagales bacterium]|nr:hypothetical protein [Chitinophagales bacterium]
MNLMLNSISIGSITSKTNAGGSFSIKTKVAAKRKMQKSAITLMYIRLSLSIKYKGMNTNFRPSWLKFKHHDETINKAKNSIDDIKAASKGRHIHSKAARKTLKAIPTNEELKVAQTKHPRTSTNKIDHNLFFFTKVQKSVDSTPSKESLTDCWIEFLVVLRRLRIFIRIITYHPNGNASIAKAYNKLYCRIEVGAKTNVIIANGMAMNKYRVKSIGLNQTIINGNKAAYGSMLLFDKTPNKKQPMNSGKAHQSFLSMKRNAK